MSAAPHGRRTSGASWLPVPQPVPRPWLFVALIGLLLVARQPSGFVHPEFNAEEGALFFQQAHDQGFWSALFTPVPAYPHLTMRLTAGLALLVPLELAPLVFKLAALAVQMLPVAYLLADGVPGFVVTPFFRVLAAAISVVGPNTMEIYLNVNNSQWHLTLAACLILLAGPRVGTLRCAVDAGVLLLFATSGPFSLVCAPLALWSWWRARRTETGALWRYAPLLVVACGALQLVLLLLGSRATSAAAGLAPPSLAETVRILGLRGVCNSLLGLRITLGQYQVFHPAVAFAAAALLPLLAFAALRLRNAPLLTLLVLAAASVGGMLLFPIDDPRYWLDPDLAPRYFFFTMLFTVFSLLAVAERGGRGRWLALPGCASALLVGMTTDFLISPTPDTHWPDQIAVFRSLPSGTDFFIPVYPQPTEWGLTLRQRNAPGDGRILERYPPAGGPLNASLEFLGSTLPPESVAPDQMIIFAGYAVDTRSRAAAGGVFLRVDGRFYPAVTGMTPPDARGLPMPAGSAFTRYVPRSALGPGAHRLQLFALDHTGTTLLEPGPAISFTLP